ncbi:hypothetical protein [Coleofasciculus sp. G2-EDA-02]
MKNLSLSLYAFHLRQTLTDAPDRASHRFNSATDSTSTKII